MFAKGTAQIVHAIGHVLILGFLLPEGGIKAVAASQAKNTSAAQGPFTDARMNSVDEKNKKRESACFYFVWALSTNSFLIFSLPA